MFQRRYSGRKYPSTFYKRIIQPFSGSSQQCDLALTKEHSPDLPTSKTCKSGDVEKKPRKTWRLGPQTWRFPKYVLNENKNGRFLVSRYSLPYLCTYCILLPHILKSQFLFRCRREAPG